MTITTNSTLIRIFLNQNTDVKKLKKKRYLIKVALDNGMIVQLNDVPVEVNEEFVDFKLNNSNQMIAKQLVDTALAVLIKMPSSITIKTEEVKETQQENKEEPIMENNTNEIKETFEEKLNKITEEMEINRQGVEQLEASCEKLSQEAEKVISNENEQPQKQSEEIVKEDAKVSENKPFSDKVEESTLYTVAKTAGKVVGIAALGVVGYLSYNFIKSKLTS